MNARSAAVYITFFIFVLAVSLGVLMRSPRIGYVALVLFAVTIGISLAGELVSDVLRSRNGLNLVPWLLYGTGILSVFSAAVIRFFTNGHFVRNMVRWGFVLFLSGITSQVLIYGIRGIRNDLRRTRFVFALVRTGLVVLFCAGTGYYIVRFLS